MKNLRNINLYISFALLLTLIACSNNDQNATTQSQEGYETLKDDPTNTRIYTLDNGLKVYLSVNEESPRVNTAIAVRAGSKNDPSDATGLAHYLEHMLFKGTDQYGSSNFEKEAPLLAEIERLYEVYRTKTDDLERQEIYQTIDSISQVASQFAIANEYDKMVSEMGAKGTNAYTSQERTVYINDIPTNQLEKWIELESERFRNPQMRLFHTELEAVYEEKNRSLDNDYSKAWEATMSSLFPNHQYGQQTTIGTIDHLKNPSITKIKDYYTNYYVPNNMAICLAGDFDPDQVMETIKEKFGKLEQGNVPDFMVREEQTIEEIHETEVLGPDAEFMYMAYRFPGVDTKESELIQMCDMILANSTAGLIDLNLNQKQKVLNASSFTYVLSDYSAHMLNGSPKEGQTLEDVKNLLLEQIDSLKAGAFPDWLPEAAINDLKKSRIRSLDNNGGRTRLMVNAFIQKRDWEAEIASIEALKKYSKEDIVNFAKENYADNFIVVYKRTGEDASVKEVVKPEITPIDVNRDTASTYLTNLLAKATEEIQPRFLEYDKDIQEASLGNGIKIRTVQNKNNELFNLYYVFDMGTKHNRKLDMALQYLPFLGTDKYTAAEIQQEFYKIGCDFNVSAGEERVYVFLNGLNENFEDGVRLLEHLMENAQPDKVALRNMVDDMLKQRKDAKLSKSNILWGALYDYGKYGEINPFKNIVSEEELKATKASELTKIIQDLNSYEHRMLYYGPMDLETLSAKMNDLHQAPENLNPVPEGTQFEEIEQNDNSVYFVNYDMKQAEIVMISKKELYNPKTVAAASIFNEYFGGGMGSIVFQEMRESKALAYSVYSTFQSPGDSAKAHYVMAYIGTQADKLKEAMAGMTDLLNNMPESEKSFELAKKAAMEKIRTERITKNSILWNYETALKRGVDYDLREDIYKTIPKMSLEDLKDFHASYVKDGNYAIMVIGDSKNLDMETLESYGPITSLTLEEIFGY